MHDRLERLRRKLAATDDPHDRADLEAAIAALAEKIGISVPPPPADDRAVLNPNPSPPSVARMRPRRGVALAPLNRPAPDPTPAYCARGGPESSAATAPPAP